MADLGFLTFILAKLDQFPRPAALAASEKSLLESAPCRHVYMQDAVIQTFFPEGVARVPISLWGSGG